MHIFRSQVLRGLESVSATNLIIEMPFLTGCVLGTRLVAELQGSLFLIILTACSMKREEKPLLHRRRTGRYFWPT